jgi:tRNA pseudouridine38-40 synthase
MKYFAELSYKGTNYCGWQKQPNDSSVQETLEDGLTTILGTTIDLMGCGRTDTGVHAKQYFAHFIYQNDLPEGFLRRLNKYLPKDISIHRIFEASPDAHARFDAYHRAYEYHIELKKNPFTQETAFYYTYAQPLDLGAMQKAAALLMDYELFFPFCKTNTDVKTMRCELRRAEWIKEGDKLVFHIASNRFLRGMVRLIVGMCLNVGLGKTSIEEVREAMDKQERLKKSYSVPPQGLFLTDIRYPDTIFPSKHEG